MNLSQTERSTLEMIANGQDELLARRATIILMSETNIRAVNIAKEVELSPRTVKRWLSAFEQKRLGIFPELAGALIGAAPVLEAIPAADGAPVEGKKAKVKKNEPLYPTRKKIGLEPADSFAEAGRKVLGFHFARMLKHEPGARSGQDIEALHNMRVATRRMRAALRIFGPAYTKKAIKPLLKGLKETGRALGPVRDLDVFMDKLHNYRQTLPESELDGLQTMLAVWSEKREQARREMLAYLNSKKYARFKKEFLKFVKTEGAEAKSIKSPTTPNQIRHMAPGLIYTAYSEVRAYETVLDNAPVETLHQLRIAFKRLRYLLEFLQETLGDEAGLVITEVKAMQDHLGDLQDAEVAGVILKDFLSEWEQHQLALPLQERQNPVQIVSYLEAKLQEHHELLTACLRAWQHFNRLEVRQALARAVAGL